MPQVPLEDSRYLRPMGTATRIIATMNARELRHIAKERALNLHAQWEIRSVAQEMLRLAHGVVPAAFKDLMEKEQDG